MPCRDYYDDHPDQYFKDYGEAALRKQISFAESALCQALAALEHVDTQIETVGPKQGDFYNWINFAAAGITKSDLVKWHKAHKKLDAKHREEEQQKQLKASALAKLTPAERQALGIK